MRKFILSLTFLSTVAAEGQAADLPVKALPPPPPAFSWTGCYVGGHVGGAIVDKSFANVDALAAPIASVFAPGNSGTLFPNTYNLGPARDVIAGGQIGCNIQASQFVFGIEADASWSGTKGGMNTNVFSTFPSTAPIVGAPNSATSTAAGNFNFRTDAITTLTGRAGYSWDRVLLYAKGGAAWANDSYNYSGTFASTGCNGVLAGPPPSCFTPVNNPTAPFNFSASENRFGWTVGLGVEWAFHQNWSAKLEYDYLDFGTRTVRYFDPNFGAQRIDIRQRIDEVKFGVNYRFGPFAAR